MKSFQLTIVGKSIVIIIIYLVFCEHYDPVGNPLLLKFKLIHNCDLTNNFSSNKSQFVNNNHKRAKLTISIYFEAFSANSRLAKQFKFLNDLQINVEGF
jgi:hypothetical protein